MEHAALWIVAAIALTLAVLWALAKIVSRFFRMDDRDDETKPEYWGIL